MLNELKKIKEQLISQIDSWKASDEQKIQAKKQIKDMPDDKFEEFLVKNKVLGEGKQECPFCLIVNKKLTSYKIAEDEEAVAVLEINPMSRGHTIIIPKKHEEKEMKKIFPLAEKLAERLKSKLKVKEVRVSPANFQGHSIIDVVPVYEGEKQERKKVSKEDLEKLQKELTAEKTNIKKERKVQVKKEELEQAPKRFP